MDLVFHVAFGIADETENAFFHRLFGDSLRDLSEVGVGDVPEDQPRILLNPFFSI
jgi:hypothetical protein